MILKRNRRNPISFSLLNSSQALNTWHLEAAVASILHLYPLIQQYFTIVLHNISSPLSSNPTTFQTTLDFTTSTYPTLAMWLQTYYFTRDFYNVWFIASCKVYVTKKSIYKTEWFAFVGNDGFFWCNFTWYTWSDKRGQSKSYRWRFRVCSLIKNFGEMLKFVHSMIKQKLIS